MGARMTGSDEEASRELRLDLRGLHCPMPVLRARKALRRLPRGGVLVLECTDPLTVLDIPNFVAEAGHALVDQEKQGDLYLYRIIIRQPTLNGPRG